MTRRLEDYAPRILKEWQDLRADFAHECDRDPDYWTLKMRILSSTRGIPSQALEYAINQLNTWRGKLVDQMFCHITKQDEYWKKNGYIESIKLLQQTVELIEDTFPHSGINKGGIKVSEPWVGNAVNALEPFKGDNAKYIVHSFLKMWGFPDAIDPPAPAPAPVPKVPPQAVSLEARASQGSVPMVPAAGSTQEETARALINIATQPTISAELRRELIHTAGTLLENLPKVADVGNFKSQYNEYLEQQLNGRTQEEQQAIRMFQQASDSLAPPSNPTYVNPQVLAQFVQAYQNPPVYSQPPPTPYPVSLAARASQGSVPMVPPAPPSYPAPLPPGFLPPETPVAVSSTGAQFQQVKKPRQQKRARQPAQSEATKFDPIEDQILLQGEKPRKKKKIKMSARMIEYLDRNKDHIELEDIHSDDLQEEEEEEPDDDPLNLPPHQLGSQAQWNPPSEQLPPPTPSQPRPLPQTSRPRAYEDMQREVSSLPEPLRSEVDKVLDKWLNAVKQLPKGGDHSGAWGIIATIFDKYGINDPAILDLKQEMYVSHLQLLHELQKV